MLENEGLGAQNAQEIDQDNAYAYDNAYEGGDDMEDTVMNYDNASATLGDRIEAARRYKDMSRADLAERLGVRKSTIKKWENDQSEPRSNRLYMMAGVLDCQVMWLLNGEGDSPLHDKDENAPSKIEALKIELADLQNDVTRIAKRIEAMQKQL